MRLKAGYSSGSPRPPLKAGAMVFPRIQRDRAAIMMLSASVLAFEVLMTRIFSVTLWYHFAFLVISIAMFGGTVGALLAYLIPSLFDDRAYRRVLVFGAMIASLTMMTACFLHLYGPAHPGSGYTSLVITFASASLPFMACGICTCLLISGRDGSMLYAADLIGAALGCLATVGLLKITDAVSAVIACAALAAGAALVFSVPTRSRHLAYALTGALVALVALSVLHKGPTSIYPITWAKGSKERALLYERWNTFSRIAVQDGNPDKITAWSLSARCPESAVVPSNWLKIDAWAGTPMIRFDGDLDKVGYLKYDLTNFSYYLKSNANVMIVGSGCGRDILSALVFKERRIVAAEINADTVQAANDYFGDFTGHLSSQPGVTVVCDEARSYLARQKEQFDLIQLTFIDTFAATAAGAFALTENSLYTTQGWQVFLQHLAPGGYLTISRGLYWPEIYRLTALARSALISQGIANPEKHIMIVVNKSATRPPSWGNMAMIIVSPAIIADRELDRVQAVANQLQFSVIYSPRTSLRSNVSEIASGQPPSSMMRDIGLDVEAPSDDRPFFFNMLKMSHWLSDGVSAEGWSINNQANRLLLRLVVIVGSATCLFIVLPLILSRRYKRSLIPVPLAAYFFLVGLGFMLIEISLLQRLSIFLGHPTYGLLVGLEGLLLATGLGSYTIARVFSPSQRHSYQALIVVLVALVLLVGLCLPNVLPMCAGWPTPARIMVALAFLLVVGWGMGMAVPIGLRLAHGKDRNVIAWLWGINGCASVLASSIGVIISLSQGIGASYWTGASCYLLLLILMQISGLGRTAENSANQ